MTELERRVLATVRAFSGATTSKIADQTPYGPDRHREVYEPRDIRPVLRRLERQGLVRQVARQHNYARTPHLRWEMSDSSGGSDG